MCLFCNKGLYNIKVSKGAKTRNRYNQVPHLTQDTNGKVTNSQLDITNESQEVSPFPTGDHKAHINKRLPRHSKQKPEKKPIKDPQKKYRLGTFSKIFYWGGGGGLKGNFGYCPRASFLRREMGKVVWVPSFDHFQIRLSTIFKFASIQVSDILRLVDISAFSGQKSN